MNMITPPPMPPTMSPHARNHGRPGEASDVIRTAQNPWAGFWKRFVAYVVDCFVLMIPNSLLYFVTMMPVLGAMAEAGDAVANPDAFMQALGTFYSSFALYMAAIFALNTAYFTLTEGGPWQASLGKKAMGLAVVNLQGRRIGYGVAFLRTVAKMFISGTLTLGIGFLVVAFSNRKKGLHDMVASTYVVNKA